MWEHPIETGCERETAELFRGDASANIELAEDSRCKNAGT